MGFGGPVWHASVAPVRGSGRIHKQQLRGMAVGALAGVGGEQQWHQWTGYAYHLRRRLSPSEQLLVGDAVDCRTTDEWDQRFAAAKDYLPRRALEIALEERA